MVTTGGNDMLSLWSQEEETGRILRGMGIRLPSRDVILGRERRVGRVDGVNGRRTRRGGLGVCIMIEI